MSENSLDIVVGEIKVDCEGTTYTEEDGGYACRFWFGEDKAKAEAYLEKFLKSYSFMMGDLCLEKLPNKAIEVVRSEYTIKICADPAQARMDDLEF